MKIDVSGKIESLNDREVKEWMNLLPNMSDLELIQERR